jgi:hypothetical protein
MRALPFVIFVSFVTFVLSLHQLAQHVRQNAAV